MRLRLFYILFAFLAVANIAQAQTTIDYSASVEYDEYPENVSINNPYKGIKVYAFNSHSDADAALADLEKGVEPKLKKSAPINEMGEFTIRVFDDKNSIVLVYAHGYGAQMIPRAEFSSKRRITLKKNKEGTMEELVVEESKLRRGLETKIESMEFDGTMRSHANFIIPYRITPNMRIVAQPMWYDRVDITDSSLDTVFAYRSVVYNDNDEYKTTQARRMDFKPEMFDSLQYLNSINKIFVVYDTVYDKQTKEVVAIREIDKSQIDIFAGKDTIYVHLVDTMSGFDPDTSHPYPFGAMVEVVDYNTVLYRDTVSNNGERVDPLKFLEYRFADFRPDSIAFYEKAEVVNVPHEGEMRLNFEVGKWHLSLEDSVNYKHMKQLTESLQKIENDSENRSLDYVCIYGMASPDGNYMQNKELARKRARELKSKIHTRAHITDGEPVVASWELVADSLERDGYTTVANEIREFVVTKKRGISSIPSYDKKLMDTYLDKFRSVHYVYTETRREKKQPDLILKDYKKDPESVYRSGYWILFNHLTDKELLREVSRSALKVTRDDKNRNNPDRNYGYWAYAAGILAHACVATGVIDFEVLDPFLNLELYKDSVDGKMKLLALDSLRGYESGKIERYYNAPENAANQLIMTLKSNNRARKDKIPYLEQLVRAGGEAKYDTLLAFSKCKRGKFQNDSVARKIVASVSPTNAVVMNLAMHYITKDTTYLSAAIADTLNLPDRAATNYMKSVICLRKKAFDSSKMNLAKSFCKDIKMIAMANNDKELMADEDDAHMIVDALTHWREMMPTYIKEQNRKEKVVFETPQVKAADAVPDSLSTDSLSLNDVPEALPVDSMKPVKKVVYEEMSDEEYRKQPFVIFNDAYEKLTDKKNKDNAAAIENLYRAFDSDKEYISIFNVLLIRDITVSKDKELVKKLREIRNRYKKAE